ncbi:Nucleoside diphosphate kinase protein [Dioscorea alata]|uniref:Nucleoside diphosphate kinase protein n=1 Tax=Dioscorea alata TaxID=55571 RepID=A0ACB7U503_DIOAL|nr:Nucleoside diphosphate kinase protein [Dioscorea alata]
MNFTLFNSSKGQYVIKKKAKPLFTRKEDKPLRLSPFLMNSIAVSLLIFSSLLILSCTCNADSEKERTLAMIKPDGLLGNYTDDIKKTIIRSGFSIVREMMIQLDEEKAKLFYTEHSAKSFFPDLVRYMTSGPVLLMVLEKYNAISDWRSLIGPTDAKQAKISHPSSIRAMCGSSTERNCVHGSDSRLSAAREISFFFKDIFPALEHDEL